MIEFFIAKKHMLERKRQSFVSIIGIMIGITVLTVSIGISNGLDKNMIQSVLSITSHIKYQPAQEIKNYVYLKEQIEKISGVKGVVANVPSQGILKFKNSQREYVTGVKIQGFDMKVAQNAMELDKKIIDGNISEKPNSIIIGKELSMNSGIFVGDTVILINSDGKEIQFVVEGVFQTGYYDYDVNVVMVNLKTAQYMAYFSESVSEFDIILNDPYKAEVISSIIKEKIGINVRTWGELNKNLLSALTLEKTVMIVVFSLIVIVAGFLVWVTLNTLVREKIKDIGIMRAMGCSTKSITKIFLFQGIILGTIGIVTGVILSLVILWYIKNYSLPGISSIYYIQKIPIEISIKEIVLIVMANFIIIMISSVSPAYRASKLETQEALKYE